MVGEAVQLSVAAALNTAGVNKYVLPLRLTVAFDAASAGAALSNTVTVAVSVSVLPTPSVTVKVTVTGEPMSPQSNDETSKAYPTMAQSSVEPSFISKPDHTGRT